MPAAGSACGSKTHPPCRQREAIYLDKADRNLLHDDITNEFFVSTMRDGYVGGEDDIAEVVNEPADLVA